MAQLKLLQECNHEVLDRTPSFSTVSMRRAYRQDGTHKSGNIDLIERLNNVSFVDKIEQTINNKIVVISPELYNLYDNRIVWLRKHTPSAVGKYRVPADGEVYRAYVKHTVTKLNHYSPESCLRCRGTKWYVAPLSLESGMQVVEGPMLVAQEFLKCLLTTSGSDYLDDSYGASLIGTSGNMGYLDKNLNNNIRDSIRNAEMQCINNTNLQSRSEHEILDRVVINKIEPDYNNSGVYVNLTLYTLGGSRVNFNVNV